jgi:hypothetical protein
MAIGRHDRLKEKKMAELENAPACGTPDPAPACGTPDPE